MLPSFVVTKLCQLTVTCVCVPESGDILCNVTIAAYKPNESIWRVEMVNVSA